MRTGYAINLNWGSFGAPSRTSRVLKRTIGPMEATAAFENSPTGVDTRISLTMVRVIAAVAAGTVTFDTATANTDFVF